MVYVHSGALFSKGSEWFCISLCKAHSADKFSTQSINPIGVDNYDET